MRYSISANVFTLMTRMESMEMSYKRCDTVGPFESSQIMRADDKHPPFCAITLLIDVLHLCLPVYTKQDGGRGRATAEKAIHNRSNTITVILLGLQSTSRFIRHRGIHLDRTLGSTAFIFSL